MSDAASKNTDGKPELGWLPVSRLKVDQTYQRTLEGRRSQRLIALIAERFDWSAFQAIVVTKDGNDWLVIDGQHRVEAAKLRGETHVPAVIIKTSSTSQEAAIFVAANLNRVAVNPYSLYHAKLVAKDEDALKVEAFCKQHDITIPRSPTPMGRLRPGETLAIQAITKIALDEDDQLGRRVVDFLRNVWPNEPGALSKKLIRVGRLALTEFCDQEGDVDKFLRKMAPAVWLEEYPGGDGATMLIDDMRIVLSGGNRTEVVEDVPNQRGFFYPKHESVDPERRCFIKDNHRVRCAPLEWKIFECLAECGGRLVSNDKLFHALYADDIDGGPDPKIIDVLVCRLRAKCPFEIETVWSEGYILNGYKLAKHAPTNLAPIDRSRLMAGR